MKPGMGATADYMTLEDGDVIDVAMYSNNNFYKDANAGFPYFTLTDGTAAGADGDDSKRTQESSASPWLGEYEHR